MKGIYRLKGEVKHYDWGGKTFIPSLLDIENKVNTPFAEYWMGIHPLGTAEVEIKEGEFKLLNEWVDGLPYLLKVLDVKNMLSIQVHPSKAAAETAFAQENAEGIPLDAPERNYKDANHKPELMVALSDFWLLHGFKPEKQLAYTLQNVVELRELLPLFNQSGYAGLYRYIMEMPQPEVNRILQPLVSRIAAAGTENIDKSSEDFWTARAASTFANKENIDRGIFSIYLFNIVQLKKGEGVFQDAGVPHAYLEGQNVEIMANSDNVLRGGLTTKHIDVKELLKHVKCEATHPNIITGEKIAEHEKIYRTPVKDFQLSVFELEEDAVATATADTAEIILVTEGVVSIDNEGIVLQQGKPAAVILPGTDYRITGFSAKSIVFRAAVPV